jgi:hypothetical protein
MRSLLAVTLLIRAVASAQGVPGGIERGSREGERAAGPVGRIVGGAIGGVVGGVNGVLGIDQRPRFRSYVVERHHPSYAYDGDVRVGADLLGDGVMYYDVRRSTELAIIGTQSSIAERFSSTLARTASLKSSRKVIGPVAMATGRPSTASTNVAQRQGHRRATGMPNKRAASSDPRKVAQEIHWRPGLSTSVYHGAHSSVVPYKASEL